MYSRGGRKCTSTSCRCQAAPTVHSLLPNFAFGLFSSYLSRHMSTKYRYIIFLYPYFCILLSQSCAEHFSLYEILYRKHCMQRGAHKTGFSTVGTIKRQNQPRIERIFCYIDIFVLSLTFYGLFLYELSASRASNFSVLF